MISIPGANNSGNQIHKKYSHIFSPVLFGSINKTHGLDNRK